MDDDAYLESVLSDVERMLAAAVSRPNASVIHCPGWSISDLVRHHGGVLRWAESVVRTGEVVVGDFSPPADSDALAEWYVSSANDFVATARKTDRDRPCWTFGGHPARTWFWPRRQALEAVVHRWDATLASGVVSEILPALAQAGITEVVETLLPRQVALGRTPPLSARGRLVAWDVGEAWELGDASAPEEFEITADASTLLLLLWGRLPLGDDRIRLTGAQSVAAEISAACLTP